jgi:sec-independent protein translocase protein TatB
VFDISFSELMIVGAVALIVIGPEKLPRVARTAGHFLGRFQRYVAQVKSDISREMELTELRKLQTSVEDAARDIEQTVKSEMHSAEEELRSAETELRKAEEEVRRTAEIPPPAVHMGALGQAAQPSVEPVALPAGDAAVAGADSTLTPRADSRLPTPAEPVQPPPQLELGLDSDAAPKQG